MSRADLARCSGLQRSTVSAIIDQLIDEGWVTEGAIGQALRGRRPRFLHLNVERAGILAVDLRPAITTVGLAGVDARFVEQTSWPTPKDPEVFIRQLAKTVTLFRNAHPRIVCEGMGVSVPGRADRSGRLVFAPNLGWGPVDLKRLIEAEIGLPVVAGKRGERVRARGAVVRPSSGARPSPGRGHRLGGDRRRPPPERSARARRRRDGRRVRPRQRRRERAAVSLRQSRMLGTVRVELRRRSSTTSATAGTRPARGRR